MQKSYQLFLALLTLALMCAACIERSASITGNGTKLLNDTWLGDKLGFSQRSLPVVPLDFSGTSVTFIGTAEMLAKETLELPLSDVILFHQGFVVHVSPDIVEQLSCLDSACGFVRCGFLPCQKVLCRCLIFEENISSEPIFFHEFLVSESCHHVL